MLKEALSLVLILIFNQSCDALICGKDECVNGKCEENVCYCHPCYTGPTCQFIKNKSPLFERSTYKVNLNNFSEKDSVIANVKANDEDKCLEFNCGCGLIVYSILDDSAKDKFEINPNTGEIKLLVDGTMLKGEYSFVIKATNKYPFDNTYDTASIFVNAEKSEEQVLDRVRRAVPSPSKVDFLLTQVFPAKNLTTITIGQRLSFKLFITFPVGSTTVNLELFAPETTTDPVMIICNAKNGVIGKSLGGQPIVISKQEGLNGAAWPYTHVIYTISNVVNNNANPASIDLIQAVIEFDVIMAYSASTLKGTTYYVSAGAEYSNGTEIWVGQYNYIADVNTPPPNPQFSFTGDKFISPSKTAEIDLVIQAPEAYLMFSLTVATPLNNTAALSLCLVYRYYVGEAYNCIPDSIGLASFTPITINNQIYYTNAKMQIPNIVNQYYSEKDTRKDPMETTIKVKIVARVNPNLWIGSNYYSIGVVFQYAPLKNYSAFHQMLGVPLEPFTPYAGTIVHQISSYNNANPIKISYPGRILLEITIPTGVEIELRIISKFLGEKAEICGISFLSAGLNIPCVDQINFNTTFTMSPDKYAVQAKTVIPSIRHVKVTNKPEDNILKLLVVFKSINDTSKNKPGSTITSAISLEWTGGANTEQKLDFTLDSMVTATVDPKQPTFTFGIKGANPKVEVGGSYQIGFSIRIFPGVIYAPTILEFFMPLNGTIQIGLCGVTINYVGKNILCFNPDFITQKFIYSSKVNDPMNYDKLHIPVGTLCSIGTLGDSPTQNDEIQITLDIVVLNHVLNIIKSTANLNAGMMMTTVQVWVGNQPITIVGPQTPPTLATAEQPYICSQRTDAPTNIIFQNDLAIIQYIIKIAPGVVTGMKLTIYSDITAEDNFGVCQITILKRGSSIPCINGEMTFTTGTPFSKYKKTATFKFPNILNAGTGSLSRTMSFDENSILVEVVVKFGGNLGNQVNVKGKVEFSSSSIEDNLLFTVQNTLSRFNGTIASTEPRFNMFLSPLFKDTQPNISSVAYGEAMRSVVKIQVQPNSFQTLKIIFASAPNTNNQMDIISVNILTVGRNIPCLQTGMIKYVTQIRPNSLTKDLTSIDLGTVCHKQFLSNTTTIEDDMIYIEAVFRVWKSPTDNPKSLQINVIGLNNNDQVYVTRILFDTSPKADNVINTNILGQSLADVMFVTPTSVKIGDTFIINVTLGIPPYSQFKSGTILISSQKPPDSDSYYFVANSVNFTGSFGQNIGINKNELIPLTLKSQMNTSQLDTMFIDLGIVQNTATTYRMGQLNYSSPNDDDKISISLVAKLTDQSMTTSGSIINLDVTVNFGTLNLKKSIPITVVRTNSETLDFNIFTNLLTSNKIYTSSDPIIASVQAAMLNTSTLECRNFTIYIAIPKFMQFSGITNSTYSCPGYSVSQLTSTAGGFYFTVPYFFYMDNISVIFSMSVTPGTKLTKDRVDSMVTVPVIYACKTLNWPSNPSGNKMINKVNDLRFNVKGADINITGQSCNDDLKVTDNNVIKDCAISSYMSPFSGNDALKIRINSGSYWKPHIRSGVYNKLRYIDIRFGKLTTVSKVTITSTIANKPQIINIYGTMDGISYFMYQSHTLSYSGNVAKIILMNPPFTYRGIRVGIANATQDDDETGMNIDLIGCAPAGTADPSPFDPCSVNSLMTRNTQIPDFYYRGYLYSAPYIFICDEIPFKSSSLQTYSRCFRSSSSNTWEDLGNQVGKIIGFDNIKLLIYAISSDLSGYIVSEDNGLTWLGINRNGWLMLKNLGNIQIPIEIPWTKEAAFDPSTTGSSCTKYQAGIYNFCYDGIYSQSSKLYQWNNCC